MNVAIDCAATVRVRPADLYRVRQGESLVEAGSAAELAASPDSALAGVVAAALGLPPVEIELASDSPRGGGLGASSAMAVALIAAGEELLGREPSSAPERVHLARDLEARLMGLPTGIQDHYPGLLGGALEIRMDAGGEEVRRLAVDLDALGAHLLVVYSGVSHFSAGQNWQVVRRRLDGERESVELFSGIAEAAAELAGALEGGDFPRVGTLMGREWSFRRRLAEGVSTPELEHLLESARRHGAWGGKACGAGGGGCLAVLCPPEHRTDVAVAVEQAGGRVLAVRPTGEALAVARA